MGELDDDQPAELTLRGQADLRVFGDPLGSAMFNVHGQYLHALEQHLDTAFDRLGNPGAFERFVETALAERDRCMADAASGRCPTRRMKRRPHQCATSASCG